ncbi:glycosyl hydrolase family 8 [Pelagicoccus sp. SDUM812003]|uniref:glycosyl hydrolase family 8 n=1 Tax=Pelagicoccus sp. SDUM812003 TaxID=3041267 RepID=UPI00280CDD59|nr:glycosyl hydrolase family 8 [Pelagicoccus sp. SDUM812003]MDQ8203197.1 glycosyl hydrolase family 8 [Pelagicoccus sp. SDUM812003]
MIGQTILAFSISSLAFTGLAATPEPHTAPNLFADYLGKTQSEVDAKVDGAFQQLFYGDEMTERLYYPVEGDMAYIWDVASDDVRSEGMSYGMMVAVQLDKKQEFDRLWKWSYTYMRLDSGPFEGYFNWQNATDGTKLAPGSAPDGEEWFATALYFAANRWGNGQGIYDYQRQADDILRHMLHKQSTEKTLPIIDREYNQVRFVPWQDWDGVTDASYHLPAFYEIWAKQASADNDFWAAMADHSRAFFKEVAHPDTGLMPDYSYYKETDREIGDHKDFRFDAWRVMSNVALDHAWWGEDPQWQVMQSNRILSFLSQFEPNIPNQFSVDGTPLDRTSSPGLYAMAASAALAADREIGEPFVERLWETDTPSGHWRYYDGIIYMLGLLQVSGNFQVIE